MAISEQPLQITSETVALCHDGLQQWFELHKRDLPWRATNADGRRDPYRVWVSEVMLQQTRVDQALPYYLRFVEQFPTVAALAGASQEDVLRVWEGMGYYARARNLHRAAGEVVDRFDGRIPSSEAEFRSLHGVGPYTAAAVLSLAFDAPLAAVDGNIVRVLSRLLAFGGDVKRPASRRHLQRAADVLLNHQAPGAHNEALMELGATVCTPTKPDCVRCPLSSACRAYQRGTPADFPVSSPKAVTPHLFVSVGLIFDQDDRVLLQKRPEEGMLGGMWEFPGGKLEDGETPEAACIRELREELAIEPGSLESVGEVRHAYSHFRITLHGFRCDVKEGAPVSQTGAPLAWVAREQLADYPMPRASRKLWDAAVTKGGI